MVLGGLIIPDRELQAFQVTMASYRETSNMRSELKWTKVKRQKLEQYQALVDRFFALNNSNRVRFHSMIIDNHQVDHRRHSAGDSEVGFYKFYYQLLLHCFGRKYCLPNRPVRLAVTLDERTSSYCLLQLKRFLNNGMSWTYTPGIKPFVSIEPCDSKKSDLLQLVDVMIGAVGWCRNGYRLMPTSGAGKNALCEYITRRAGLIDLSTDTILSSSRFSIWNFQLRKRNSALKT